MKAYIIDEYVSSQKNGIGTFMQELVFSLRKIGQDVRIIEFNSKEKHFCIKREDDLEKICFPPFPDGRFTRYHKTIEKFFRLYIDDCLENVFMFNHSPCENLMTAVKKSFPLSKMIFTIHDMGWTAGLFGDVVKYKEIIAKRRQKKMKERYGYILDYFDKEKKMYTIADKVVCLSQDTRQLLASTYQVNPDKIHLIPNAIRDIRMSSEHSNTSSLREEMHVPKKEKIILCVGRLTEVKGCIALIQSFGKVLEQYPDCRLVMAGTIQNASSVLESCSTFAAKVSFTGLISREELSKWYRIADIGTIPSYSEQSSYTAIEMMMHGLPIAVAKANGLKNMFEDNTNAKMADICSSREEYVDNLAVVLLDLLKNNSLRRRLGHSARKNYLDRFQQKRMQEDYENLFRSLNG